MNITRKLPNLRTADPEAWKLVSRYADFIGVSVIPQCFLILNFDPSDLIGGILLMVVELASFIGAVAAPVRASMEAKTHYFEYGMLPALLSIPWILFVVAFEIGGPLGTVQHTYPSLAAFWPKFQPVACKVVLVMLGYSAAWAAPISIGRCWLDRNKSAG